MAKIKVYADLSFLAYRSKMRHFQRFSYTSEDGIRFPTGTIYSVLQDLLTIKEYFANDEVLEWGIALDTKPTSRLAVDKEYKSHRREGYTEHELKLHRDMKFQMKELRIILRYLGFNLYEAKGYEADDVLATLAKKDKGQVRLITNDKDLYQVLSKRVSMFTLKEVRDYVWFKEKYGIEPSLWTSVQSLTGDTTDNIKGVKGVGDKIAIRLLNTYGDLENAVKNIKKVDTQKALEVARIANKLVTLDDSLVLACKKSDPNILAFRRCLVAKRMKRTLKKLPDFKEFCQI